MAKFNFFKRIICLLLILTLVFCLISCGKSSNTEADINYTQIGSQSISDSIHLVDAGTEGSASLTLNYTFYQGGDGLKYVALSNLSYTINNSPIFDRVEITCNDGNKTHSFENNELSGKYTIDGDIVLETNNSISATMVIHMTNGKTYTAQCPG